MFFSFELLFFRRRNGGRDSGYSRLLLSLLRSLLRRLGGRLFGLRSIGEMYSKRLLLIYGVDGGSVESDSEDDDGENDDEYCSLFTGKNVHYP